MTVFSTTGWMVSMTDESSECDRNQIQNDQMTYRDDG